MNKHTPGPWFIWREAALKAEGFTGDDLHFEMISRSHFDIMAGVPTKISRSVVGGCRSLLTLEADDYACDDEDEALEVTLANARLIAAAPELYEALWEILDSKNDDEEAKAIKKGMYALAKAKGESNE